MINGLMIFFTLTSVAVLLYPIIKLLPSWLERRLNRKIEIHRASVAALDTAMAAPGLDPGQVMRLAAQRDWHRAALQALAPDRNTGPVTGPLPVDLAA
jgi:hypothetical protein